MGGGWGEGCCETKAQTNSSERQKVCFTVIKRTKKLVILGLGVDLQSKAMQVIQRSRRFQEELAIHSLGNQNVSRITSNAVLQSIKCVLGCTKLIKEKH